jgi:hypothetical protein
LTSRRRRANSSFGINADGAVSATSLDPMKRFGSTVSEHQLRAASSISDLFVTLLNIAKGS